MSRRHNFTRRLRYTERERVEDFDTTVTYDSYDYPISDSSYHGLDTYGVGEDPDRLYSSRPVSPIYYSPGSSSHSSSVNSPSLRGHLRRAFESIIAQSSPRLHSHQAAEFVSWLMAPHQLNEMRRLAERMDPPFLTDTEYTSVGQWLRLVDRFPSVERTARVRQAMGTVVGLYEEALRVGVIGRRRTGEATLRFGLVMADAVDRFLEIWGARGHLGEAPTGRTRRVKFAS